MPSYPVNHNLYLSLWSKYKPVLIKLMRDAANAPQSYQFISHEFRDINPKERSGHSFKLEAHKRKAQNNIKMSVVAQDLLEILIKSNTAYELMEESMYEFKMDKEFMLTVTKHEVETVEEEAPQTQPESESSEVEEAKAEQAENA